jgi:hypothetical protein
VYWDSGTAHLLPRLLRLPDGTSRTGGPLFLSERRPVPARRPAAGNTCPHTRPELERFFFLDDVRKVADKRLHATVAGAARRADAALPGDLVATLKTPEGSRFSELERLCRPPTRTTGTAFARALERVDEIGAFQPGRLKLSRIPPNRMAALARYALGPKAALLERASESSARRCSPR